MTIFIVMQLFLHKNDYFFSYFYNTLISNLLFSQKNKLIPKGSQLCSHLGYKNKPCDPFGVEHRIKFPILQSCDRVAIGLNNNSSD